MNIFSKKKLFIFLGIGGLGGVIYYLLSSNKKVIAKIDNEEMPLKKVIIPRDRSNLKNVNWVNKMPILQIKEPRSNGFKAAHQWAFESMDVAARWLQIACEDPTEEIDDEEWNSFCEPTKKN